MHQEPYPGPTTGYLQTYRYAPTPTQPTYDTKSPFDGDRFRPRKRINDPIFLVLFILQARIRFGVKSSILNANLCFADLRYSSCLASQHYLVLLYHHGSAMAGLEVGWARAESRLAFLLPSIGMIPVRAYEVS